MGIVQIPLRSDLDDYSLVVDLAGTTFGLRFTWNTRDARWMMDIRSADGTDLLNGVPVVVDYPLTMAHVGSDLPEGWLIAVDTSGERREIESQDDLGSRVKMQFIPFADLA